MRETLYESATAPLSHDTTSRAESLPFAEPIQNWQTT